MNRGERFLRDQDNYRRAAQRDHARRIDQNAQERQRASFVHQNQRDQRIQENIAARDWNRRNDDHKKSVFYAELQRARFENRPPIYSSHFDVPDLPRPRRSVDFPWGTVLILGALAVLLVGAVLYTIVRVVGGLLLWTLIAAVGAFLVAGAVWVILRFLKKPSTPDAIAKADAWNPVRIVGRILAFCRRNRSSGEQQPTHEQPRAQRQHFSDSQGQQEQPQVYRPQPFKPNDPA